MKSTPPRPPALCLARQQAQSKGKESSLQPTRCHKECCTGWVIRPFQKAMHNTAWAAEPEGSVLSILLAELTPWQSCQQQGRVAVRPAALAHGAALTDAAASEAVRLKPPGGHWGAAWQCRSRKSLPKSGWPGQHCSFRCSAESLSYSMSSC